MKVCLSKNSSKMAMLIAMFAIAFTFQACPENGPDTQVCSGEEYDASEHNCINGQLVPVQNSSSSEVVAIPSSSSIVVTPSSSSVTVTPSSSSDGVVDTSSSSENEVVADSSTWYNDTDTEFTLTTAGELDHFAKLVNGGNSFAGKTVKLGADIMINDTAANWQDWERNPPATPRAWTPIGNSNRGFGGIFDGGNHVVSGIYINTTGSNQGLFGHVVLSGKVRNVGVAASYIRGGSSIGCLVGGNYGIIDDSHSSCLLKGLGDHLGGLVGWNGGGGIIENCHSSSIVDGETANVGGLVGTNTGTGTQINNSYATGAVTGAKDKVGGLVGYNSANINDSYSTGAVRNSGGKYTGGLVGDNDVIINRSYSTSAVRSDGNDVGGLVGRNVNSAAVISNSYSTGTVRGNIGVGGLVGNHTFNVPTIRYSYSIGSVTGISDVGGLVGRMEQGRPIITSSYYYEADIDESDVAEEGTARTEAMMKRKSNYVNWDFDEVWGISSAVNDGYPYLLGIE